MQPEIEAKFLSVDHDLLRARLKGAGAECEHPMRLMKRKNYDFPDKHLGDNGAWARLRDEGDKVTMSYKQLNERTMDGTYEICLTVENFDLADEFLTTLGLVAKNYQETRRETWKLDGVEVVLDEWPWVRPIAEVEGPDEQSLKAVAGKLGLDWTKAVYGSAELIYQAEYDVLPDEVHNTAMITFETTAVWPRKKAL